MSSGTQTQLIPSALHEHLSAPAGDHMDNTARQRGRSALRHSLCKEPQRPFECYAYAKGTCGAEALSTSMQSTAFQLPDNKHRQICYARPDKMQELFSVAFSTEAFAVCAVATRRNVAVARTTHGPSLGPSHGSTCCSMSCLPMHYAHNVAENNSFPSCQHLSRKSQVPNPRAEF